MSDSTCNRLARQHQQLRQVDAPELAFEEVLSRQQVQQIIEVEGLRFRDRIFNPLVTTWAFLLQVLHPAGTCRTAVLRIIAWCRGQSRIAPGVDTGSYCKARQRLPESFVHRLGYELY